MIYLMCTEVDRPVGGVRVIYRLCDLLNRHGLDATVLHGRPGYRAGWFENSTRLTSTSEAVLSPTDLLVVPEIYGDAIADLDDLLPRVILNQNAYKTWGPLTAGSPVYAHPSLLGVLCISEDNHRLLRYSFPDAELRRIHLAVNERFTPAQPLHHGRTIAFMPRRRGDEAMELLKLLAHRGALSGWSVEAIDGYSEEQTIDALRRASIFLAFSEREGLPAPPGEAMAAGCLVIGYHGRGGAEIFLPDHSISVPDGDVVTFAQTVEQVLRTWDSDALRWQDMSQRASRFIKDHFSQSREEEDVVAAFRSYLGMIGRPRGVEEQRVLVTQP